MESIATTDILAQVKRICSSSDLKTKKLLCRFLKFVINETLEGRGDQLKGYTIGISILGKDMDFDPEQDSLVRIHAGRLRRALKLYYLDDGRNDPIVIAIPKGTYQPRFSLAPPSSFQNEYDSISKEIQREIPVHEPTIAVLPFVNLSGDPDKEYFAHGFSYDLSIELTKFKDLNVVNCWRRPNPDNNLSANFYDNYGARFILDGSILINLNKLKIQAKLVDTISGKQLWAERYHQDLSLIHLIDIGEQISDEIALIIGSETGIVFQQLMNEATRVKPNKLSVFDAILKFFYYQFHISTQLAAETFQCLQQALIDEPDSGVIHAMLADMYAQAYAYDFPINEHAKEKMVELAEKAVILDPENQIVRLVRVFMCLLTNQKERFFKEVDHCLRMKLHSPLRYGVLGLFLCLFGEWERGKEMLDKAMNKHIGYPIYFYGATSLYYYRQGNFEAALAEAQNYDMLGIFWGPMLRIACLGKLGEDKKLIESQKNDLLSFKPDFEDKAEYLISRLVKEDDLVQKILDGLVEAGLKVKFQE